MNAIILSWRGGWCTVWQNSIFLGVDTSPPPLALKFFDLLAVNPLFENPLLEIHSLKIHFLKNLLEAWAACMAKLQFSMVLTHQLLFLQFLRWLKNPTYPAGFSATSFWKTWFSCCWLLTSTHWVACWKPTSCSVDALACLQCDAAVSLQNCSKLMGRRKVWWTLRSCKMGNEIVLAVFWLEFPKQLKQLNILNWVQRACNSELAELQ